MHLLKSGCKTRRTTVKSVKRHQDIPKSKRLYDTWDPVGFADLLSYLSKQPTRSNKYGADIPFYLKPLVHTKGHNKDKPINELVWYQAESRRGSSASMIGGWMKKCCRLAGNYFSYFC
jgi:hypothetical protein